MTMIKHMMAGMGGVQAPFTPFSLGAKLKHWSEVDGLVNGSTTEAGTVTGGELIQLTDRSGNNTHWTNDGNKPTFDGTKIVFAKASSQGMINNNLPALAFTNLVGEVIVVAEKISGEAMYPFIASRGSDILKRCLFGIQEGTNDLLFMQIKSGSGQLNVSTSSLPFINSGKFIASFSTVESGGYNLISEITGDYRLNQPISTSNSGSLGSNDWFGDVIPSNLTMMNLKDSSPAYYSGYIYALFYLDSPLTLQERNNLFCYLSNKYL